jgi:hypothetical protein
MGGIQHGATIRSKSIGQFISGSSTTAKAFLQALGAIARPALLPAIITEKLYRYIPKKALDTSICQRYFADVSKKRNCFL